MSKLAFSLTVFCAALIGVFAILGAFNLQMPYVKTAQAKPAEESAQARANLSLENFTPNARITYKILSPFGLLLEGNARASQAGELIVSHPEINSQNHPYLIYNFEIENSERGDALNVLLRMNNETGEITASGDGAAEFSSIEIKTHAQNVETRADWAGLFQERVNLGKGQNADQNFEIALHGINAFTLPNAQTRPGIIKVLSAPGGGGPTDNGVNEFTPSPAPLSTSNAAQVRTSIQGIIVSYIRGFMLMTEQLSAVQMLQVFQIGQFFDAKQQMETQRLHQELKAEAIKDYHPSEQMCRVGSYVRSVADSEQRANYNKRVLNETMATRFVNEEGQSTHTAGLSDVPARLKQYREVYCDPQDNNSGLRFMCDHDQDPNTEDQVGAVDATRVNKDIDYVRTLASPYTVEIDFSDEDVSEEEEDVLALARNLYWPTPLTFPNGRDLPNESVAYLDARRLIALNSIAHNSFASLAGMKSQAAEAEGEVQPGWAYMKTLLREFGFDNDAEIEALIGERPSYWAQMDILTKKMYQNPDFYTNLYDKPANVERMDVVLEAMKLMQLRDHFDSSLRREMISSAMIENELTPLYKKTETLLVSPR